MAFLAASAPPVAPPMLRQSSAMVTAMEDGSVPPLNTSKSPSFDEAFMGIMDSIGTSLAEMSHEMGEIKMILKSSRELQDRLMRENIALRNRSGAREAKGVEMIMITLTTVGEDVIIRGNTFTIKDELKQKFGARWNSEMKNWSIKTTRMGDFRSYCDEKTNIKIES